MAASTGREPIPSSSRRLFAGIGAGFVAILIALVAATVVIWRSQRAIERDLELILDVEEPTSAAAYEMEINAVGAGLAVLKYVLGGDPAHLERLAKDDSDFGRALADYERLAATTEERALARAIAPLHARYREVGAALMEHRDRRADLYSALSAETDTLLAPAPGGAAEGGAPPSAGAHVGASSAWLGTYLVTSREGYRERCLEELGRARQRAAAPDAEPGPVSGAALEHISERLHATLEAHDALRAGERELTRLRGELDALLDEGVQARTRRDLHAALDDAERNLLRLREVSLALIGAAAIVSVLAGAVVYQRSVRLRDASTGEVELAFQRLQASEARRGTLLRRLVAAQEEERARIARELHDQLGQDLAALALGLASLQRRAPVAGEAGDAAWAADVQALQELTQQLADEVHGVAWKLRPALLDDLGLHDALANLVETWTRRSGVPVDLYCDLGGRRLPREIETTLYRLVQEALTNAAKHAGARSVNVVLQLRPDLVRLAIEDDGRGFDAEDAVERGLAQGRLGLVGMRERVEQAGGSLEIESAPGKGTAILAHIPLARRAREGAVA